MSIFNDAMAEADLIIRDELGDTVVIVLANTVRLGEVTGFFRAPHAGASVGSVHTDLCAPEFEALACDVAGVSRGAKLIHQGVTYDVVEDPGPDGTGMMILPLRESA